MSTRGLCGFRVYSKDYLAYNHHDSYPDGLGCDVVNFIGCYQDNLNRLRERVISLKLLDEDSVLTKEENNLLCEAEGNLELYLQMGVIPDNKDFLQDGLFCEWAYVIDLDEEQLVVYKNSVKVLSLDLATITEKSFMKNFR